jgi:hypothetical protein
VGSGSAAVGSGSAALGGGRRWAGWQTALAGGGQGCLSGGEGHGVADRGYFALPRLGPDQACNGPTFFSFSFLI